jgi:hypothetical protein
MKKFLSIVFFLILLSFNAYAIPKVGEIVGQMGTTWNEREGKNETVVMGYELLMNDFLQTGEDGGMILEYVDGTKFTMGPNAEAIIDEFSFDTSMVPIEVSMNISVNVGSFTYESGSISELGGDVEIFTPTATVTMQGTAISGSVAANGATTIVLLPDSNGNVGQVTVANESGSQILSNPYTAVTVFAENVTIKAPSPLGNNEKKNLFDLDSVEETIEDEEKFEKTKELIEKNNEELIETIEEIESEDILMEDDVESKDVEMEMDEAQELEEQIISEELTIDETETITTTDLAIETEIDIKSTDTFAEVDEIGIEEEVDTSYYDEWEDDLKDWGYIDEDNQISVWDAEGEQTMDWDDAKNMYAEMDQAYFDAIGCSDCTWDSVNWDEINWDEVDWDGYMEDYNELLEDYGLTSYTTEVDDVTEEVEDEATSTIKGYDWEDFKLDDEYYANTDYIASGGPPTLTIENYCNYNGYGSDWCNQDYLDYLNSWYKDDWSLYKDFTSWTKDAKKIFEKWYGWCGTYLNWEFCDGQPKPWDIPSLKDKYVGEWDQNDWNNYYDNLYNWWYYGEYEEDDDTVSLEEEYAYEDDYDIDAELELLLASYDESDCLKYGYYWNVAGQSCGTEWVDNSGSETTITTSGEIINYETGEITQTTTSALTGSSTQTGRYTTGGNTNNAAVVENEDDSDYSIIDRTHGGHTAYVNSETTHSADVQIVQESETQNLTLGSDSTKPKITIIQTD